MRRVPEWLPEVLALHNPYNRHADVRSGAIPAGTDIFKFPEPPPTRMDLVVYDSPALVNGLLMTEITSDNNWNFPNKDFRVERFFFGYRCGGCREVFLIHKNTRRMEDLGRDLFHDCDPSDIRMAVRNAREMGRERGEYIMEGYGGKFWTESRP